MTLSLQYVLDDAESAKASMKGQSVSGAEAKKQGEVWAQVAGSKIDKTVRRPSLCLFCVAKLDLRSGQ